MKTASIFLCATLSIVNYASAQMRAYGPQKKRIPFESEYAILKFRSDQTVDIKQVKGATQESAAIGAAFATAAIEIGSFLIDTLVKTNAKRYISDFSCHQTYSGSKGLPGFILERHFDSPGLNLKFKSVVNGNFYFYELETIDLDIATAYSKGTVAMDYLVEIKPSFIMKDDKGMLKKETVELVPVQIKAVHFDKPFNRTEIRSEAFIVPEGATFVGAQVKVTEINPRKAKAEAILHAWTKNQETLKTLATTISSEKKPTGGKPDGKPTDTVTNDGSSK